MVGKVSSRIKKADKLAELLGFDRCLRIPGLVLVGVDEAGRGCLAGPVMAAAVALPEIATGSELARSLEGLNDSKALTASERERLYQVIRSSCPVSVAQGSVEEIDRINILQASFLAMKRALDALALPQPLLVLVDGNGTIPGIATVQLALPKADQLSACVAAASVLAKVKRDRLMRRLARHHPGYGWEENKGYGSRQHRDAIRQLGLTAWHRKSFRQDNPS